MAILLVFNLSRVYTKGIVEELKERVQMDVPNSECLGDGIFMLPSSEALDGLAASLRNRPLRPAPAAPGTFSYFAAETPRILRGRVDASGMSNPSEQ